MDSLIVQLSFALKTTRLTDENWS